jgi:DNA-binding transcriptional LysR family regulator
VARSDSAVDYRYLRAFLLAARHLSFSKAARELRIAQSAVSRQIKCLEASIGQQLIIRSSQSVVLTRLGHELYLAVSDFDRNLETIAAPQEKPEIRIGVLHGVLETWLTGVIANDPRLLGFKLSIHVDHPDLLLEGLTTRKHDLIISNEGSSNDAIQSVKLFDEELVLISKEKIDPAQVRNQRWITYAEQDWLQRLYGEPGHPEQIQVNSMTAVVRLARSGAGVAIVPTHLLDDPAGLHVVQVPMDPQPSVHLATLAYSYLPPVLKPVMELLQEYGRKQTVSPTTLKTT